jgi:GTPase SAR1 family protein
MSSGKIILVGDECVGKKSYINRLLSGTFENTEVPFVIDVDIQPDENIVFNYTFHVVDTYNYEEKLEELNIFDKIFIMVDLSSSKVLKSQTEFWLEECKDFYDKIVLIGNKSDIAKPKALEFFSTIPVKKAVMSVKFCKAVYEPFNL